MLTPIVTEISRRYEPVARDTFIREFELRTPPRQRSRTNVVALSEHRSRRRRAAAVPAQAA